MKCNQCQRFQLIADTEEVGQGICTFPDSWIPVHKDSDCLFHPSGEIKCKDCDRLGCDFACMTCQEEDSAMHGNHLCSSFIDKQAIAVQHAIAVWKARGWDYHQLIEEQIQLVESAPQAFIAKE